MQFQNINNRVFYQDPEQEMSFVSLSDGLDTTCELNNSLDQLSFTSVLKPSSTSETSVMTPPASLADKSTSVMLQAHTSSESPVVKSVSPRVKTKAMDLLKSTPKFKKLERKVQLVFTSDN